MDMELGISLKDLILTYGPIALGWPIAAYMFLAYRASQNAHSADLKAHSSQVLEVLEANTRAIMELTSEIRSRR